VSVVSNLVSDVRLPRMVKARQYFDNTEIENVPKELERQFLRPEIYGTIHPGMSIAITCGSRGIDNYPLIIKEIVQFCKDKGAKPFIIPAMGSHGGAVSEGQRLICETNGVTEEYCGCPIKATMSVTRIGVTEDGSFDVCIDSYAAEADGIILVNRIKNHTALRGDYESGLMKMMAIGLGKQYGASLCHRAGYERMAELVPMIGKTVLNNASVLFGVGIVDNAYDKNYKIAVLTKDEIPIVEKELLKEAKRLMPRLLPGSADVLVVDRIGKNISGSGADPGITGRLTYKYSGVESFQAGKVAVLDITDETHGNIHGVGYVDVINRRVFEKADLDKTYPNSITSTTLMSDKIPVMMKNDRDTIKCAIKTCQPADPENIRLIRITDTLHISEILISECMVDSVRHIPNLEITDEIIDWEFNEEGNLW